MRSFLRALGLITLGALLAGCKSGPSIVGTWKPSDAGNGADTSLTVEFRADKTYKLNAIGSVGEGKYEQDGQNFKMTLTKSLGREIPAEQGARRAVTAVLSEDGNYLNMPVGPNRPEVKLVREGK